MKNNENVNVNITDTDIESSGQKKRRDFWGKASTVLLVIMAIVFFFSVLIYVKSQDVEDQIEAAHTGEEMLNSTLLYGIENTAPFDIVEDVADYKAHSDRKEDKYTSLALGLAQYREAAFYNYAYSYVGDTVRAVEYQKQMEEARGMMEVHSFADYIDKNYDKFNDR